MAKLTVPGTTVGLMAETDKMHNPSHGTTAIRTCPFATFGISERGNQAICGVSRDETSCYATRGRSVMANVKRAYAARADWTLAALRGTPEDSAAWVETLVKGIRQATKGRQPVFRWFDAGDFMSPAHIRMVQDVVAETPDVQQWAPTRSWQGVIREWEEAGSPPVGYGHSDWSDHEVDVWNRYVTAPASRWTRAFADLCSLPNIAVRPSALYVNEPFDPRHLEVLAALGFSGPGEVTTGEDYTCPASDQGGACDGTKVGGVNCTACYAKDASVRRYKTHAASFITVEGLVGSHRRKG